MNGKSIQFTRQSGFEKPVMNDPHVVVIEQLDRRIEGFDLPNRLGDDFDVVIDPRCRRLAVPVAAYQRAQAIVRLIPDFQYEAYSGLAHHARGLHGITGKGLWIDRSMRLFRRRRIGDSVRQAKQQHDADIVLLVVGKARLERGREFSVLSGRWLERWPANVISDPTDAEFLQQGQVSLRLSLRELDLQANDLAEFAFRSIAWRCAFATRIVGAPSHAPAGNQYEQGISKYLARDIQQQSPARSQLSVTQTPFIATPLQQALTT
jgi:hypothetical protein